MKTCLILSWGTLKEIPNENRGSEFSFMFFYCDHYEVITVELCGCGVAESGIGVTSKFIEGKKVQKNNKSKFINYFIKHKN